MGTKSEIMVKQYYIHTVVRYKINNKSLTSPLKGSNLQLFGHTSRVREYESWK